MRCEGDAVTMPSGGERLYFSTSHPYVPIIWTEERKRAWWQKKGMVISCQSVAERILDTVVPVGSCGGFCGVMGAETVLGRGEKVTGSHVDIKLLLCTFSTSLAKAGTMELGRKLDGSE